MKHVRTKEIIFKLCLKNTCHFRFSGKQKELAQLGKRAEGVKNGSKNMSFKV